MKYYPERPLIVQSDFTVLLDCRHSQFESVRDSLSKFAELMKSPEPFHTYRITPLSLWNAAAGGMDHGSVIQFLQNHCKFELPGPVRNDISKWMGRFGLLRLIKEGELLLLISDDEAVLADIYKDNTLARCWLKRMDERTIAFHPHFRGIVKMNLIRLGFPVLDLAGYHEGESLDVQLRSTTRSGRIFQLRDYQSEAIASLESGYDIGDGSGVIVLPCGGGKTIVGIGTMARLKCATLILTTNMTSVKQWKRELLDKTNLNEEMIGEYCGSGKEVRPITIATYQILTHRKNKEDDFAHMRLFNERDWGLIVYDEVHLLPAPVFRVTADIQATRRLGLTATLIREDGREHEVFSLIGPKRYEMGWKLLESKGWIAKVECAEIRVPMPLALRERYEMIEERKKFRLAGENEEKLNAIRMLLQKHSNEPTLIIGHYIDQLNRIADFTGAPMICGELPYEAREQLYMQFKQGEIKLLIVSKVANFAVDLPDAAVAIQVSGSYGSRQEEAQRLGRILRPKPGQNRAYFYSVVSSNTNEQHFSLKRQLFLVEQGYSYRIEAAEAEG